jgi:hypothetical protein
MADPNPGGLTWGSVSDWIVALGTLVLAVLAAFQDKVRAFFFKPMLSASIRTEPPDCHVVPLVTSTGTDKGDSLYLRLWIKNGEGSAPAEDVEVYA